MKEFSQHVGLDVYNDSVAQMKNYLCLIRLRV